MGKKDLVARRYGRVLFLLAEEHKKTDRILKDVTALSSMIKADTPNWITVTNPTVSAANQQELISVLKASFKLDLLMENFLRVIVEKGRLPLLEVMLSSFIQNVRRARGQIDGILKTSAPLSKPTLDDLSSSLEKSTGLDVTLLPKIEPEILGGASLQIGSLMVDASLGTRLHKLRQTMKG